MADIKLKDKQGVPIGYTDVDTISVPDLDTDDQILYHNVEMGTLNVTDNGEYTPSGNNVWNKVNVDVPTAIVESLSVTENGTYTAEEGKAYNPVTVSVPDKLTALVDGSITTVTEDDLAGITNIKAYAFYEDVRLTAIDIPGTVSAIGAYAFYGCSALTELAFPSGMDNLGGSYSCRGCLSLVNVIVPEGVTTVSYGTFRACSALPSITLPSTVANIGSEAFYDCTSLSEFYCKAVTPPSLGATSFSNVPANCAIFVPADSVAAYKAAQYWSDRAAHIQAIPTEGQ